MYGYKAVLEAARRGDTYEKGIILETPRITLVNVKAPVVATTNWWWLISALVVA